MTDCSGRFSPSMAFMSALLMAMAGCPQDDPADDDTVPSGDDDDDSEADDDDTADDDDSGTADDDDSSATDDDDSADDDDDPCGDDDDTIAGWPDWQDAVVGDADASFVGEMPNDWAGYSIEFPGDLDGDGTGDVAIVAPENDEGDEGLGKVYLLLGHATGWGTGMPMADLPSVVGGPGDSPLDELAIAGDINGDGLADLHLRSRHQGADGSTHQYLILGRSTGWSPSMPLSDAAARTTDANEVGTINVISERAVGDIDGDGHDDWLLSDHFSLGGRGQGLVVAGATATGHIQLPDDALGWVYGDVDASLVVTPLGDIDGDGLADIAAYQRSGAGDSRYVDILRGRAVGYPYAHDAVLETVAEHRYEVATECSLTGYKLLGDINADGIDDFAVTTRSPGGYPCAGLHVFFGLPWLPAELDWTNADVHIAQGHETQIADLIGDINGDGIDDLAFLGPGEDPETGSDVYVVFGRSSGWPAEIPLDEVDVHIRPVSPFPLIGPYGLDLPYGFAHPRFSGDLDGDGIDELVLTCTVPWLEYNGVPAPGAVLVFAGRPCWPDELETSDAQATFVGDLPGQNLGEHDQMGIADVNGDGMDDLVVASIFHPVGSREGTVWVFFGRPRTP